MRSLLSYCLLSALATFVLNIAWQKWWLREVFVDPSAIISQALRITSRSWELGTLTQALLELEAPELTVFASNPFPEGQIPPVVQPDNVRALKYARSNIWTNHSHLLFNGEGSPADPASLGIAALLLGGHDQTYSDAARRQAEYLMFNATRLHINQTNLAISHRDEPPELWGDFIYMVPPFLAYYGAVNHDLYPLQEAVRQCQLYNDVLETDIVLESGKICRGLWRHIVSGPAELPSGVCCSDSNVWLTSNAWAVAGMTRVLATVLKWSPPATSSINLTAYDDFVGATKDVLINIINSMLTCTIAQGRDMSSGLLRNYLDGRARLPAADAFGDTAGTALMAAAVCRLAVLFPGLFAASDILHWADANWYAVIKHIDKSGIVGPVADVSNVPSKVPVRQTSEGQSMALLMYSARRDCVRAGLCDGATRVQSKLVAKLLSMWRQKSAVWA
ncbi:uncharacterized protein PV06_02153 [Exophiala oligosperma]|uniref:Linalool dehydratase/isomerase domain-containing protein n=1 Tax=Exophiala oligosperma TaxID=215243 RepID=A0A0D2DTN4_9EURO|nr:uncharacterized protein PV06_02153 [Exophiala oligosperma]KIW46483.1 hypothetical protein PV06_02153 [Exophiala oligosperma]